MCYRFSRRIASDAIARGGANLGGMVAPNAFTSYEQTRPWAKSIAKAVKSRVMPPWYAAPEFNGQFFNERTLTDNEIETIVAWVSAGAPRGNTHDMPPPLSYPDTDGWQIGEPDLVVFMPEKFFVEDDDGDLYKTFFTEITEEMLPADRWMKAIEFRPGSPVVHHILSIGLGGLSPGNEATIMKDGYSQVLRKGSKVHWQMHYHKEVGPGTGVWDQSSVGIKFYRKGYQPEHILRETAMSKINFVVPAGAKRHRETTSHHFRQKVELLSLMPHMHLRGQSATYTVTYPSGIQEILLRVPQYNFDWQTTYSYRKPKVLPAGSMLEVEMIWDNSTANVRNPDPTVDARFGWNTNDEMMSGYVKYAFVDEPRIKFTNEELTAYAGKYKADLKTTHASQYVVTVKDDTLQIEYSDQYTEFFPITRREWLGSFGLRVVFHGDNDGKMDSLVFHISEKAYAATKIN